MIRFLGIKFELAERFVHNVSKADTHHCLSTECCSEIVSEDTLGYRLVSIKADQLAIPKNYCTALESTREAISHAA